MKKNSLLYLFLSVFIVLGFIACAGSKQDKSDDPCGKKHFLWKVSKGSSSVWVLGSIHMADSSFYPLPTVLDSAFNAAEALVVEMDITDDSVNTQTAKLVVKEGFLPEGSSLQNVVSESTWLRLETLAKKWNVPVETFAAFRPWMVAMQISSIAIQKAGVLPELGVDYVLLDRAATAGKAIIGLETPAEQIQVFSEVSDSLGVIYLEKTLDEVAVVDSMVSDFAEAWKCGNISQLQGLLDSETAGEKPYEKRLYNDRNKVMARGIDSLLTQGTKAFVVVGAAHLIKEDDNVLKILENKGYLIERY